MENRPPTDSQKRKSSIFTYEAPWPIYSLNWSVRPDKHFRLAIGSFLEEYGNKVELLELDQDSGEFIRDPRLVFDHPYPPTKLMFIPDKDCSKADLISTSGDFLRLWEVHDDRIELKSLLNGNKNSEFCAPLTSFDWSEVDNRRIACSSIDNTCTVWDIERETVDAQLIAHDKEVYDISWVGNATGIFASVSGDGSVRVFDLRDKEHSTIIYENPVPETPLLRLAWNKVDPRFMAVVGMDSNKVVILDIRVPTFPVTELVKHRGSVNAVTWAPYSSGHVASAGDDSMVLIWELPEVSRTGGVSGEVEPLLSYGAAGSEVNQLQWSSLHREWIAIAFSNKMQLLRI